MKLTLTPTGMILLVFMFGAVHLAAFLSGEYQILTVFYAIIAALIMVFIAVNLMRKMNE